MRKWYAVLRKELTYNSKLFGSAPVHVGRIYLVSKKAGGVFAVNIHNESDTWQFSVPEAQDIFTTPTQDIDAAHEEAIMICEAAYC